MLRTAALLLALGQLLTASRIYEVLHCPPRGRFYQLVHRSSGWTASLPTLPVAYHCIFLLGFGTFNVRAWGKQPQPPAQARVASGPELP